MRDKIASKIRGFYVKKNFAKNTRRNIYTLDPRFYLSAASSLSTYLSAHLTATSQKAPRLFTWLLKIAL